MKNLSYLISKFSAAAFRVYSQNVVQPKVFNPKFTNAIQITVPSITQASTNLNAAKSLIKDAKAISVIDNIIQYLNWYKTIGTTGTSVAVGKDSLIPSFNDIKALVQTGLFGQTFITSLLALMQLNNLIPEINAEFIKITNK